MKYGQFCPIAKAAEVLGERWTLLIVRELLMGARRFSELQRGLGLISPALLAARLRSLEGQGLIVRRTPSGLKSPEYWPTPACEALLPVVIAVGEWGLCWTRDRLADDEYDVDLLMLYLERSIEPAALPGHQTLIRFEFSDLTHQPTWWILVQGGQAELCVKDPAREVDVFFNATVRTMADVWMGDRSWRDAIRTGDLFVEGPADLTRNISAWLKPSVFAGSPRPSLPAPAMA